MFYSNFVPKTHTVFEIFDFKNTVTLKTGLRSVKVIENVTIRYSAYDFVLTSQSNHGPISHRFSEIDGDFSRKSHNFPTPCILLPRRFPLELRIGAGGSKTRRMGLPGRQRSLTTSSVVWRECTNVTDRRTDVRTDSGPQQRPR